MAVSVVIDAGLHPLVDGDPPAWASAWGEDRFGVYAAFTFAGVTQRMRWIPPGVFDMGSPEDEPGRYDDEGPVHPVTIAYGFWMFDTPCTQALWQAVTQTNPSEFKSPMRPVETVDFEDVRTFIDRLNRQIEGLDLTLPSEAEWEYACRAGTTAATYAGPMRILGEANAPILDPIAWYRGNSGVDFDLENGWDSSAWAEKQYPHSVAGTQPVKLKRANPVGLYDTLGNVWEWCADTWHHDYSGAPADGSAWIDPALETGARRVVRGGSWNGGRARGVRAACRSRDGPADCLNDLGFRCARVQSASERERRAARREPAERSEAAAPKRP